MEHYGMNMWNSRYQRDRVVDILKGIGIFLMVFRHARAPFSEFVLLFHMALFFIASGYLYKKEKCNSINNLVIYIKAKLRHLWIPYFITSSCFILLNNFFLKINIYTDNGLFLNRKGKYVALGEWYDTGRIIRELIKAIFFFSSTQMGGALWFFRTLFVVIVGYGIIDFCIVQLGLEKQRNLIQFNVSLVSLLIGWYLSVNGIESSIGNIFSVYSLIFTGNIIKEKSIMELFSSWYKKMAGVVFSLATLIVGFFIGSISVVNNGIGNPLYFLTMSIAGWIIIYIFSEIIEQKLKRVAEWAVYISIHSVWIIALHFLCFKFVTAIKVVIDNLPFYLIASFPILDTGGIWWLAYTIVGLVIPLLFERMEKVVLHQIKSYHSNLGGGKYS